jgi:hypothetical protein
VAILNTRSPDHPITRSPDHPITTRRKGAMNAEPSTMLRAVVSTGRLLLLLLLPHTHTHFK